MEKRGCGRERPGWVVGGERVHGRGQGAVQPSKGPPGLGVGSRKWEGKPRFTNRQDTVGREGMKSARSGKRGYSSITLTTTPYILGLGSTSHRLLV